MKRHIKGTLIGVLSAGILALAGTAYADSNEPIKIPIKNWSSQIVMAHVIGGMFESMGNTVEYVPVDNQASFEAVRVGDITYSARSLAVDHAERLLRRHGKGRPDRRRHSRCPKHSKKWAFRTG